MSKKSDDKPTWKYFVAPVTGLVVAGAVVLAFNAQYLIAQYAYYFGGRNDEAVAQAQKQIAEEKPEEPVRVARDPKVIIPGINVNAPVVYGMDSVNEGDVQVALRSGVLHFAGTPDPGQPGNGVYIGHSSGAPWAPGSYKFVFTALEHVDKGDIFYLNHEGKQYAYKVIGKRVVSPYDTSVLNGTDKPTATLITCTPVGTDHNRLVILGEQIHPKPVVGAAKKPTTQTNVLPGN